MFSKDQTIFVFPGQGSQFVGMASEFMTHPATRAVFEEANDALGFDLAQLMREGDKEELQRTENTQPALLAAGMAAARYVEKQTGKALAEQAPFMAGHSVGEFTALCAAGGLSFADALKLVRGRGEAMSRAVPAGQGAMAAIIGLPMVDTDSTARTAGCFVASDNAPDQQVISGSIYAIDEASNVLVMQDAKQVARLDVAGPFHTPYMEPAADAVATLLEGASVMEPALPILMNATATPVTDVTEIHQNLVAQTTQTVRWREIMAYAAGAGVTQVVELGAGNVLAKLAKRNDERMSGLALNTPDSIDEALDSLAAA